MIPVTDVTKDEQHLFSTMSSQRFLKMEGFNAELPVYIYPYDATLQLDVEAATRRLIKKLKQTGVPITEINLHALAVGVLKSRGIYAAVIGAEPDQDRDFFLEDIQAMLDPRGDLIPAIKSHLADSDAKVLILTGVGGIYPLVRSHVILENVQDIARDIPVVLFFPGTYEQSSNVGSTLSLFGRLHDDRYYRARNILYQGA